jgi:hypothetical protein
MEEEIKIVLKAMATLTVVLAEQAERSNHILASLKPDAAEELGLEAAHLRELRHIAEAAIEQAFGTLGAPDRTSL